MYKFKEQLTKGEASEAKLDEVFAEWYNILPADMATQRRGIDRIFTRRDNGKVYMVEYKTDWTAGKTGNAFVETVSVDTTFKPGWAYSSHADYLIYFVPDDDLVYIIAFARLRCHMAAWQRYPSRKIPNDGYCTHGLLVPLMEFERIAHQVICV